MRLKWWLNIVKVVRKLDKEIKLCTSITYVVIKIVYEIKCMLCFTLSS